jgi:tetratricopeptide (TPR) repeat protein
MVASLTQPQSQSFTRSTAAAALAHFAAGRPAEAAGLCQRALAAEPTWPAALEMAGICAGQQGNAVMAVRLLRRALVMAPRPGVLDNFAMVCRLLAETRFNDGHGRGAVAAQRLAVAVRPDAAAYGNLSRMLAGTNHHGEAVITAGRALRLDPELAEIAGDRGVALLAVDRPEDASHSLRRAVALDPSCANLYIGLARCDHELGRFERAWDCVTRALSLVPGHPRAVWNRAMLRLLSGDRARGWPDFEARRALRPQRTPSCPPWQGLKPGEDLSGRTLLVWHEDEDEHGHGDLIQFIRFATPLARLGARVVVQCPASLVALMRHTRGVYAVAPQEAGLPLACDVHVPVMSLPGLLGITDIPETVPYVTPDPAMAAAWQRRLAGAGPAIGLAWAGDPDRHRDAVRSLSLSHLMPLLRMPGVRWFSLQSGTEGDAPPDGDLAGLTDLAPELDDFAATAAAMAALDLVITADSAIAHLAGALGVPVWIMLPHVPDWRWELGRSDSSWYPTARLFRQTVRGNWGPVVAHVATALATLVISPPPSSMEPDIETGNPGAADGSGAMHRWLADLRLARKNGPGALAALRAAAAVRPLAGVYATLARTMMDAGEHERAQRAARHALRLDPLRAAAPAILGSSLLGQGLPVEAGAWLRQALTLDPGSVAVHLALAHSRHDAGQFEAARVACARGLVLEPGHPGARWLWTAGQFLRHDYSDGWSGFEGRWAYLPVPLRSCPLWRGAAAGEDPAGRTLLVWNEQGCGDMIQFIRFAGHLARRGANVVVECPETLTTLMRRVPGVHKVVTKGQSLPPCDAHIPVMSLPDRLGLTGDLGTVPYLVPDPSAVAGWRRRLAGPGHAVGLVWAGNPNHIDDSQRSIPIDRLQPLLAMTGVRWFSLQFGREEDRRADDGRADDGRAAGGIPGLTDLTPQIPDFAATAAVVAALDLVITVDTAVAHLAGALGLPVWVMLPHAPDWRWGLEREDTPWYPSARLFRQPARGDWTTVVLRVRDALSDRLGAVP